MKFKAGSRSTPRAIVGGGSNANAPTKARYSGGGATPVKNATVSRLKRATRSAGGQRHK